MDVTKLGIYRRALFEVISIAYLWLLSRMWSVFSLLVTFLVVTWNYRLSTSQLGFLEIYILGWMVLSSLALAQESIHIERRDSCVLISSFHLHVLPSMVPVFAQFVDLMLACLNQHWMAFVKGRISLSYFTYYPHSAQWMTSRMSSCVLCALI